MIRSWGSTERSTKLVIGKSHESEIVIADQSGGACRPIDLDGGVFAFP